MQNPILEYEIQDLLAQCPWLLSLDYSSIPELDGKSVELQAGDRKRIDLILMDRASRCPVIVEIKREPFLRQDVGQILEYRARIAAGLSRENELLTSIFGRYLMSPKLVLVVKECDEISRIACNLAGIDIYEFKEEITRFSNPGEQKRLEELTQTFSSSEIPLCNGRGAELEKRVYNPIKTLLAEMGCSDAFLEPRKSSQYFQQQYAELFLNRWIYSSNHVSIGLVEEFFGDHKITVSFYCSDQSLGEDFAKAYESVCGKSLVPDLHPNWREYYFSQYFSPSEFFGDPAGCFGEQLRIYKSCLEKDRRFGSKQA